MAPSTATARMSHFNGGDSTPFIIFFVVVVVIFQYYTGVCVSLNVISSYESHTKRA